MEDEFKKERFVRTEVGFFDIPLIDTGIVKKRLPEEFGDVIGDHAAVDFGTQVIWTVQLLDMKKDIEEDYFYIEEEIQMM